MKRKYTLISSKNSMEGFNILTFLKKNIILVTSIVGALGTQIVTNYPELSGIVAAVGGLLNEFYKFYTKEKVL